MKYVTVFLFMAAAACNSSGPQPVVLWTCTCEQQRAAAKWVGDHMEAANNRSDEEMEDVIGQLEKTSIRLHCAKKKHFLPTNSSGSILDVPPDSCVIIYSHF